MPASPPGRSSGDHGRVFTFPTSSKAEPASPQGGSQEEDRSFPPPPRGTAKPQPTGARTPPNAGGVKRRPRTCPPPTGGIKRRPTGASSPSPRLHHPGILFRQPGVTSPRIYSSRNRFSLMELVTRQHRYKTAGKPKLRLWSSPPPRGSSTYNPFINFVSTC